MKKAVERSVDYVDQPKAAHLSDDEKSRVARNILQCFRDAGLACELVEPKDLRAFTVAVRAPHALRCPPAARARR